MKIQEATALLSKAGFNTSAPQTWLDLGCGSGTFTYALGNLLPDGSKIYGMDQHPQKLESLAGNHVRIEFKLSDFETVEFAVNEKPNGVMMGNSLHYVRDKKAFLDRLMNRFSSISQMIIIEYDTQRANQWVPYPITFLQLQRLLRDTGFTQIQKIAERPSIYGQGNMYVADIQNTK
ncbi:trans-aconitate 2-methyltransferase [Dyadobacter sp. CY312]|uniref:class I SAM-dependent methyltransferase n=1 Tax=Dyadobacter sp. CY312 TaxID=2907303 RepID=UPI001F26C300|nr:class I SAM-dependent methyltransferase [Dyadobacter sp. CY312]MCE7040162.1 class I SAM-dependent methyltransferase [Dyadobacter sp. CY312]